MVSRMSFWHKLKQKVTVLHIILGTKMLLFSKKHPYIFTQIVIWFLAIVGTILATIFNYGGN